MLLELANSPIGQMLRARKYGGSAEGGEFPSPLGSILPFQSGSQPIGQQADHAVSPFGTHWKLLILMSAFPISGGLFELGHGTTVLQWSWWHIQTGHGSQQWVVCDVGTALEWFWNPLSPSSSRSSRCWRSGPETAGSTEYAYLRRLASSKSWGLWAQPKHKSILQVGAAWSTDGTTGLNVLFSGHRRHRLTHGRIDQQYRHQHRLLLSPLANIPRDSNRLNAELKPNTVTLGLNKSSRNGF